MLYVMTVVICENVKTLTRLPKCRKQQVTKRVLEMIIFKIKITLCDMCQPLNLGVLPSNREELLCNYPPASETSR